MLNIIRYFEILKISREIITGFGRYPDINEPGYQSAKNIYDTAFGELIKSGIPYEVRNGVAVISTDGIEFGQAGADYTGMRGNAFTAGPLQASEPADSRYRYRQVETVQHTAEKNNDKDGGKSTRAILEEGLNAQQISGEKRVNTSELPVEDFEKGMVSKDDTEAGDMTAGLPGGNNMAAGETEEAAGYHEYDEDEDELDKESQTADISTPIQGGNEDDEFIGEPDGDGPEEESADEVDDIDMDTDMDEMEPDDIPDGPSGYSEPSPDEQDNVEEENNAHIEDDGDMLETEPDEKPREYMPDTMSKKDFTFNFAKLVISGANGRKSSAQLLIMPITIKDEKPEILVCMINRMGAIVRKSEGTNTLVMSAEGYPVTIEGHMENDNFISSAALPEHYSNEGTKLSYSAKGFGHKGHIMLEDTENNIYVHILPASFSNNKFGNSEFIYYIENNGNPIVGSSDRKRHVTFDYDGKEAEIICKWDKDVLKCYVGET